MLLYRQLGEECVDFVLPQIRRVGPVVEDKEALDPMQ